ncbi:unnamed protein product [Mytilus coruscus]|uniref:SGNH hydrolase-type esterase domain-containing protein n=1 Tax=Mytilus coruscus TaxID=42192 RepID=A0A6J8AX91_MYTCO|nr:unnamed protein product [Mytilus coruscus]
MTNNSLPLPPNTIILGASNCCRLKISDSRIHNASVSGSTAEDIDKLLVTLDKSVDKNCVEGHLWFGYKRRHKNNTDKEIICINMTNALNKVKAEFPNADISIFSILPRKGKGPNFTKCNLTPHSVNMYIEKVCSKDQRLSFVDIWDDFCRPGMGVNPVKTLFDKNDPSGVHVNPEGAKEIVSHIKNFMSIDRLGEYGNTQCGHDGVTISMNIIEPERGPGYWKMNNSVIKTELFKNTFETFWKSWKLNINRFKDKKEFWDLTKTKIKEITITISKKLWLNENEVKNWEHKLENLLENDGTQQNLNKVELKNDIYKYYDQKSEAARIRSKINWYEKGEKSTNYFFRLEQKRGKEKLWSKIKAENGTYKNNINEILGEQLKYYEKLFASGGCNREAGEKLLHNVNKTLSEAEKRLCDSEITKDEIFKAIKLIKKDKSPGEDGITAEFY